MTSIAHEYVQDLLNFIDASPSPWHAVATVEQRLAMHGFQPLQERERWALQTGGCYYVIRDGSSIVAFVLGRQAVADGGFKIVGAHTDSPGLRIKPKPVLPSDGLLRLAVEIYGGPILASFADRDLSFAGRVVCRGDGGRIISQLLRFERPLLRLPNLAIHMNRGVNEDGLKLHKQNELPLIWSEQSQQQLPDDVFRKLLAEACGVSPENLLGWELAVYDTQPGCFWGGDEAFYADSQLDNLASCHAGLTALLDAERLTDAVDATVVCAFFDHEEIGSETADGADGSFLSAVLERIADATGACSEGYRRALAQSFLISADMAHAYQPNFPAAYEPNHKLSVNGGPAIKLNANRRYASDAVSQAQFVEWCRQADVPFQYYSHRCDMPCGSTIGPIASAKLGVPTVDVGSPMWAMHSLRESAGVFDHLYLIKVLRQFFC